MRAMRDFFKSLVFNIVFFSYCFLASLFFVWVFVLPRKQAWAALRYYFMGVTWVERLILGLDYKVTGLENLPPAGTPYILAVKHYSAYETLKVPVIFRDVAIILKRELTYIPFWGWYTIKAGMIPVDRGAGSKAIASIIEGGKKAAAEGRPILIFPQGTRVSATDTTKEKPYKIGGAKIAQALHLPVVPVAVNSAAFWPKHSFLKKGGVCEFKILPIIPAGPAPDLLRKLEAVLEPESAALMAQAQTGKDPSKNYWPRWAKRCFKLCLQIFVLWSFWWFGLAYGIQTGLQKIVAQPNASLTSGKTPDISGFPFAMQVAWADVTYAQNDSRILTPLMTADFWPVPNATLRIAMPSGLEHTSSQAGGQTTSIDRLSLDLALPDILQKPDFWGIGITALSVKYGDSTIEGAGRVDLPFQSERMPAGVMQMQVGAYGALIEDLVKRSMIDADKGRIARAFLDAMALAQNQSERVAFPFKIVDGVAYAGFVRLFELSRAQPPAAGSAPPQQKSRSDGSETGLPPAPVQQNAPAVPQP